MSRKKPSDNTIKKLFGLSGNQCAFPDCGQHMVDINGTVTGQICHIEAAETGGQRYSQIQNDEERRSFENLVLMCANHHKVTDNVTIYTTQKLKQIKAAHESSFLKQPFEVSNSVVRAGQKQLQSNSTTHIYGNSVNNQVKSYSGKVVVKNGLSVKEATALFKNISKIVIKAPKDNPKLRNNSIQDQSKPELEFSPKINSLHKSSYSEQIDVFTQQLGEAKLRHKLNEFNQIKKAGVLLLEKQKASVLHATGMAYLDFMVMHKAKENFEEAVLIDPQNTEISISLAKLLIQVEELDNSENLFNGILLANANLKNENLIEVYNNLGIVYCRLGRYNEGFSMFERVIKEYSADKYTNLDLLAEAYKNTAFTNIIKGDLENALAYFSLAGQLLVQNFSISTPKLSVNSTLSKIYNGLSIVYAIHGDYNLALRFSKVCFKNVNNPDNPIYSDPYNRALSYINLSVLYFYTGKYEMSRKLCYQAKEFITEHLNHDYSLLASVYGNLGNVCLMQEDYVKTEKEYARAHEILSSKNTEGNLLKQASIYCHEGNVYRQKGDADNSKNAYERALGIVSNIFGEANNNATRLKRNLDFPSLSQNIILTY